ncbi:hypothetical protein GWI33_010511 [Rhynchophorus ferrugineus]|uniref:Uncharacterized protein n=1 Tax=Rhynchophorus ferrugineus TaxID=354439 RepID=A0A834IQV5_RHYFE|nr:hypothetical protein GWI33_010511 [Rhynchophorus ferrugineus]
MQLNSGGNKEQTSIAWSPERKKSDAQLFINEVEIGNRQLMDFWEIDFILRNGGEITKPTSRSVVVLHSRAFRSRPSRGQSRHNVMQAYRFLRW